MRMANKERHKNVDFFPTNKIRQVGTMGGQSLYLLGYEKGSDAPVLAVGAGVVNPITLDELLKFAQEKIEIKENIFKKKSRAKKNAD
jgi:hypothetical protein